MLSFILFGFPGVSIWAIQMLWIPVLAAGVINGIGHYWGYRNFDCPDASRNISPFGILIGGEEPAQQSPHARNFSQVEQQVVRV